MKKAIVKVLFITYLLISLFVWLYPNKKISDEERRQLSQMPELSLESYLNSDFSDDFEKYAKDQFPFRFKMRQTKALFNYYVLGIGENNDYFKEDGSIIKIEYPLKDSEIVKAANKFNSIREMYYPNKAASLAIIPDKAYYSKNNSIPKMDYKELETILLDNLKATTYIDIKNEINLSDFYNTDLHLKQEQLDLLSLKLLRNLHKDTDITYTLMEASNNFRGTYYGHSSLLSKKDRIKYINNSSIENAVVKLLNDDNEYTVYNFDAIESRDQYDFFLHGAQAIVEINNDSAHDDSELIIFRDSFASNITPYLIPHYKKITLIDIRYIAPQLLGDYVDFSSADILYLYSTTVLNSSSMFK